MELYKRHWELGSIYLPTYFMCYILAFLKHSMNIFQRLTQSYLSWIPLLIWDSNPRPISCETYAHSTSAPPSRPWTSGLRSHSDINLSSLARTSVRPIVRPLAGRQPLVCRLNVTVKRTQQQRRQQLRQQLRRFCACSLHWTTNGGEWDVNLWLELWLKMLTLIQQNFVHNRDGMKCLLVVVYVPQSVGPSLMPLGWQYQVVSTK